MDFYHTERTDMYNYESYSQAGEDRIVALVLETFLGKKSITYLDVGANHPIDGSNTYLLYKNFDIKKGVLVEPNPDMASLLSQKRPDDVVINAGMGASQQEALQYYMMEDDALNSFSYQKAKELETLGHRIVSVKDIPVFGINETINSYFAGIQLDFMNIDVEGMDTDILYAIDYKHYAPRIICIETIEYMGLKREDYQDILDFLAEQGYTLLADTFLNTIFLRIRGLLDTTKPYVSQAKDVMVLVKTLLSKICDNKKDAGFVKSVVEEAIEAVLAIENGLIENNDNLAYFYFKEYRHNLESFCAGMDSQGVSDFRCNEIVRNTDVLCDMFS